jgi:ribonuclease E
MSNMETPAGSAGGDATTPTQVELGELPAKVRVHALARLLGASSRDVLTALDEIGESVRSPQSSVSRETALRVAEALLPDPDEPGDAALESSDPDASDAVSARSVPPAPLFLPPQAATQPVSPTAAKDEDEETGRAGTADADADVDGEDEDEDEDGEGGRRRRRRRGRRGRGRGRGGLGGEDAAQADDSADEDREAEASTDASTDEQADEDEQAEADDAERGEDNGTKRRRRRRRRKGAGPEASPSEDDPPNTVVHVREAREDKAEAPAAQDEVRSVRGSTRLEAKRQRRRDGREAGRRRVPVLSEAEFLARRESVDRRMVVRERGDQIQIGVLEDDVLVEHFVTSAGSGSLVGNVYLGRVQNVLPSMEAAFVDIGRGRNAVLYAGEVDWDAAGLEGKARRIEQALSTGDSVLVQVTKDPVGHKGARLTTQISLPGRFLVYVPGGGVTGISRKLPDTERKRLKEILRRIVPDEAGVIIRTASEGIIEEELGRDVRRLQAQWEVIKGKAEQPGAKAPQLLYEEPDLLIKVVRDMFTEDFSELVVQGGDAWDTINAYVQHVAPDLVSRLRRHVANVDVFTEYRVDEQLAKALDRKVWLPSGGYLVIDRTEAMTVIDVNTGKFTGSGGNLEETVTRNNLEAAEEIVRQLRLRDLGGIIVIDFIDMVLESNRDLVLRRLTECLGRDRTRHQVAEVTSLGLVQMTRKRVGTGLLEAFSSTCEHCRGRGVTVSTEPVYSPGGGGQGGGGQTRKSRRGKGGEPETPPEHLVPAAPVASSEPAPDSGRRAKRAARREPGAPDTGRPAAESEVVVVAQATAEPVPPAAQPPSAAPPAESGGPSVGLRPVAGGSVDHAGADAGAGPVAAADESAVEPGGAEQPSSPVTAAAEPAGVGPATGERPGSQATPQVAEVGSAQPAAEEAGSTTPAAETPSPDRPRDAEPASDVSGAGLRPVAGGSVDHAGADAGAGPVAGPGASGVGPGGAEQPSSPVTAAAEPVSSESQPPEPARPEPAAQEPAQPEAERPQRARAERAEGPADQPDHGRVDSPGWQSSGEPVAEHERRPSGRNGHWPERDKAGDQPTTGAANAPAEQPEPVVATRRPARRGASRPAGPPLGAVKEN